MQPSASSHESCVQGFPSSHSGGRPPTQEPFAHWSVSVHASPSSHGAVLAGLPHPPLPSHSSAVQGFWSSVPSVPAAVKQSSPASSQTSLHSSPPAHGSPVPVQIPLTHES